jgi:hypothetical protein
MTPSVSGLSPGARAFLEYVEHLRQQPPHPGFPQKSFADQCKEQGIKPIDKNELMEIVRGFSDSNREVPSADAAGSPIG